MKIRPVKFFSQHDSAQGQPAFAGPVDLDVGIFHPVVEGAERVHWKYA